MNLLDWKGQGISSKGKEFSSFSLILLSSSLSFMFRLSLHTVKSGQVI